MHSLFALGLIILILAFVIKQSATSRKSLNFLVGFIIVLSIIPIYKIPFLPVSPDNMVYLLLLFLMLANYGRSFSIDTNFKVIIITYVLYHLLIFTIRLYEFNTLTKLTFLYRDILLLLGFSLISKKQEYYILFKIFTFAVFFSAVWGLLMFLFGEPFAGLRIAIINNPVYLEYGYFTKGMRIVGFNASIFGFSYVLAALPTLLLTLYKFERNIIYFVLILISFFVLLINAERAAFAFSLISFSILYYKWFRLDINILLIISIISFSIWVGAYTYDPTTAPSALQRVQESTSDDLIMRLGKAWAGILAVIENPIFGGKADMYSSIYYRWYGFTPTYVHNTYVNVGMNAGIGGWLLCGVFSFCICKIILKIRNYYKSTKGIRNMNDLFIGTIYSFVPVLGVAFFHNAGIYGGETTSWTLLGFIIACNNIIKKSKAKI
jgi:hypothetical protein